MVLPLSELRYTDDCPTMAHFETTALPNTLATNPKSPTPSKKTRKPLNLRELFWDRFQTYGKIFLGTAILLTVLYLLVFPMPLVFSKPVGAPIFKAWPLVNWGILIVHMLTALPPLIIGIIAFSKRIRNASLKWHRWMGTTYCVCIWISAVCGVLLAFANTHGPVAKLGFGFLGIGWFMSTLFAYTTARARDIVSHRRWMIRSYAFTLAVVSIRPMFLMDPLFGITTENWYLLATWMCWVPNVIIAEIYIRSTKPSGHLKPERS